MANCNTSARSLHQQLGRITFQSLSTEPPLVSHHYAMQLSWTLGRGSIVVVSALVTGVCVNSDAGPKYFEPNQKYSVDP
jgi:hypothetical protein